MSGSPSPVGSLLREWRSTQGMSQLDLALAADVSSRHVSFIETGRSEPSREMVLRLAETLGLSLREQNSMLVAAGYAPVFRESDWTDSDLSPVRRALELVLRSHEPYPAFVLDASWNVLLANQAYSKLNAMLLPAGADPDRARNVMRLVLDPELLRPSIVNWEAIAHVLGHRIRRQLRVPNLPEQQQELFESLLAFPGVQEAMRGGPPSAETAVVIPMQIDMNGLRLSWFSTIATIGTPQDVTLQELCIESLFPADEETERAVAELSS